MMNWEQITPKNRAIRIIEVNIIKNFADEKTAETLKPFSANFELETPLQGDIKEEFLRISKLINVNVEY